MYSFVLGSADTRRDKSAQNIGNRFQAQLRMEYVQNVAPKPCPSGVHFCGACEPNVPHILGQHCAPGRSSWSFSHLFVMYVNADPHMCRVKHLVS